MTKLSVCKFILGLIGQTLFIWFMTFVFIKFFFAFGDHAKYPMNKQILDKLAIWVPPTYWFAIGFLCGLITFFIQSLRDRNEKPIEEDY